ncbi:MAG: hypothetical protein IPP72_12295 [Chitinophagaceae bacterium]|nr:hypothetical protein [Chitinophagaceae bacterium]
MSYQMKVVLISFAAAIVIGFLFTLTDHSNNAADYFISFGVAAFFGGLLELIIGLFLLLLQDKKYAQGFLLSGGLLMVIGFTTCTSAFSVH